MSKYRRPKPRVRREHTECAAHCDDNLTTFWRERRVILVLIILDAFLWTKVSICFKIIAKKYLTLQAKSRSYGY